MSLHTERFQILLRIAREYQFSFDDLDDWTQSLDWQEFQDWSEIFPKVAGQRSQQFPLQLQEETAQPDVEFVNDNADNADRAGES